MAEAFDLLDRLHDLCLELEDAESPLSSGMLYAWLRATRGLIETLSCACDNACSDVIACGSPVGTFRQFWKSCEIRMLLRALKAKADTLINASKPDIATDMVFLTDRLQSCLTALDQ